MQEALKNTNSNAIELKETISDCISREKRLKGRIKELEQENEVIASKNLKFAQAENELRAKIEEIKVENLNLKDNVLNIKDQIRKKEEEVKEWKLQEKNSENLRKDLKKKDIIIEYYFHNC